MRVEELRLGNVIEFEGMYCEVQEIDMQGVMVFIKDTQERVWIDLFQFIPIPLTEEILLKCGFEYIESKKVYKLYLPNDNQLLIGFNFQNELKLYYKVFNVDLVDIKYLHQLQNLYWCLCGKELNVNI